MTEKKKEKIIQKFKFCLLLKYNIFDDKSSFFVRTSL